MNRVTDQLQELRKKSVADVAIGLADLCMVLIVERAALRKALKATQAPVEEILGEYVRGSQELAEIGHTEFTLKASTVTKLFNAQTALKELEASQFVKTPEETFLFTKSV